MADEPETPDTEELLLTEPVEPAVPDEEEGPGPDEDGEEVFSFGDETDPKDNDTGLVKHLRAEVAKARREAAEARKSPQPQKIEVGEKPTLLDFDYDEDKYDAALDEWKERKAAAAKLTRESTDASQEQAQQWEAKLTKIADEKVALGKGDADETFETVKAALSESQLATVIAVIDEGSAAKFIYALGKHPAQLAALAAQNDPIRLIKDVTRLEGQLKMIKRKAPEIDTPERGSGKVSKEGADKTLAKLEAEADKTGNRTAVIAYKRKLKEAAKA